MSYVTSGNAAQTEKRQPLLAKLATRVPLDGLGFDWLMVTLYLFFLGGFFLDAWAHNHGRVDDTFFTPWHFALYGGFGLVTLGMGGTLLVNRLRGLAWEKALPAGYHASLLGVLTFGIGGFGDMLWHELFGVETDFDALFSPTHLLLGVGMALIITGPLRAAWRRPGYAPTWSQLAPALFSLAGFLCNFTLFMLVAHPLTFTIGGTQGRLFDGEGGQVGSVLSILVMSALLIGCTLWVIRRWQLPRGALAFVWGFNTLAMTVIMRVSDNTLYLTAALLVAAVLADLLLGILQPSAERRFAFHLFAFLAPVLFFGAYFLTLIATQGTGWTVHMWTGAVFLSGVVGLLLSHLLLPPPIPQPV